MRKVIPNKKSIGRPMIEKKPQHRRNVTLAEQHIARAEKIGDGNVSKGIRIALMGYKK